LTELEYVQDGIYAYDKNETIDQIAEILQSDTETHGFVKRIEIKQRFEMDSIKVLRSGGEVVACVDYNHPLEKRSSTVYHLGIRKNHRGNGYREELVDRVLQESPYNLLMTKVPEGVDQNRFWKRVGEKCGEETGVKRRLNVYRVFPEKSDTNMTPVFQA